jgi:hypothetical protein
MPDVKDALIYSTQASPALSARSFVVRRRRQAGRLSRRRAAEMGADRAGPHRLKINDGMIHLRTFWTSCRLCGIDQGILHYA